MPKQKSSQMYDDYARQSKVSCPFPRAATSGRSLHFASLCRVNYVSNPSFQLVNPEQFNQSRK